MVISTTVGASTAGSIGTPELRPVIAETVRGNYYYATSIQCSNQT